VFPHKVLLKLPATLPTAVEFELLEEGVFYGLSHKSWEFRYDEDDLKEWKELLKYFKADDVIRPPK